MAHGLRCTIWHLTSLARIAANRAFRSLITKSEWFLFLITVCFWVLRSLNQPKQRTDHDYFGGCKGDISTIRLVNLRTIGKTNSTTGKAKAQEIIQLLNQSAKKPSIQPKLRIILIKEMMPLIKHDKKKGITTVAHFIGNLGTLPKIIARCFMPSPFAWRYWRILCHELLRERMIFQAIYFFRSTHRKIR